MVKKRLKHLRLMDLKLPEKVVDILDKGVGEWKLKLKAFENWLTKEEQKAIKEIPICRQEGRDILLWPYTKNGEYTVKSGYHKAREGMKSSSNGLSTSHMIDNRVWEVIWKSNVPSKIKVFLWRVCRKTLPIEE